MGVFQAIVGMLSSGFDMAASFLRLKERGRNEQAGANAERLKHMEKADAAREAMGDVAPDRPDDLSERLRRHNF